LKQLRRQRPVRDTADETISQRDPGEIGVCLPQQTRQLVGAAIHHVGRRWRL
jgi:hypothetical protein